MQKIKFPALRDDPKLGKVPLVGIDYLPNISYYSIVNPVVRVGRNSTEAFTRFAFIKEGASIVLTDALINHTVTTMTALGLERKTQAIDVRTNNPIDAEIDLATYGIAISALRTSPNIIDQLRRQPIGPALNQALASNLDFGNGPEEILSKSFKWVLGNPFVPQQFYHVGQMNIVP